MVVEIVPNSAQLCKEALNEAATVNEELVKRSNFTFEELQQFAQAQVNLFAAIKQCAEESYQATLAFEAAEQDEGEVVSAKVMDAMSQYAQTTFLREAAEESRNVVFQVDTAKSLIKEHIELCNIGIANAQSIYDLCVEMSNHQISEMQLMENSPSNLLMALQDNLDERDSLFE